MKTGNWVGFIVGLGLFLLSVIAVNGWINEDFYVVGFFGLLFLGVVLVVLGLGLRGKNRWRNLFMASLMLFLFSVLYIYSLGFFLAPLALVFMVLSARKLASQPAG